MPIVLWLMQKAKSLYCKDGSSGWSECHAILWTTGILITVEDAILSKLTSNELSCAMIYSESHLLPQDFNSYAK